MEFNNICKRMRDLLTHITQDLSKAEGGNKAASQRVRTGTVKLEKIAKGYRKESVLEEKRNKGSKKSAKKTAKTAKKVAPKKVVAHVAPKKAVAHVAPKKAAAKPVAKPVAKKVVAKVAPKKVVAKSVKAKAAPAKKAVVKPHALALRKPTAKLPGKR